MLEFRIGIGPSLSQLTTTDPENRPLSSSSADRIRLGYRYRLAGELQVNLSLARAGIQPYLLRQALL